MASIIKSQDQDSWGGGSAGSLTDERKCPKVLPLGGQRCQLSEHYCQGIYHCSELDMTLLDGCERYAPDDDEMRDLFEAEREVNIQNTATLQQAAAAFYNEALKEPCKAKISRGGQPDQDCNGEAVYRKYKKQNFDGKEGFIGCSAWIRGNDEKMHRFMAIPRNVKESLVKELFDSPDGRFKDETSTKACARVVSVRSGAKGRKECSYTHIRDGKIVQGHLKLRKCPVKIKIYSPLDREDRRAIVCLEGPHNHPRFPSTKLSRDGRDMYEQAVIANGVGRTTALQCDKAATTKEIFDGSIPSEVDPALGIARNKRKIIHKLKNKDNPHGNGLEGVLYKKREDDSKLPLAKRYIHEISSQDGTDLIITMLAGLVERVHDADATLHDNTYKRVHGDWKEWEVVIWDKKLNMRLTVARIYSNHETRSAFSRMWTGFWDTVERVTGKPFLFKFMDGCGTRAILVDGCKPQVDGCGDALIIQIMKRGGKSKIAEMDPQTVVQHIVQTCDVHLERKLDDLAKTLPQDVMSRVRGFPFLKTSEEVKDFKKFCEESEYKNLRDWIIDKKGSPWFIPSVNRFMSKIPEEDWFLTPGNTNLNESAHPFTNKHTGINLPLLDAIKQAQALDMDVEKTVHQSEDSCILETRANAAAEREDTAATLKDIDHELKSLTQAQKDGRDHAKELRERKKVLQAEKGIKRSPRKKGSCGKVRLPTEENIAEDEDEEVVASPSLVQRTTPVLMNRVQGSDTYYLGPPMHEMRSYTHDHVLQHNFRPNISDRAREYLMPLNPELEPSFNHGLDFYDEFSDIY
ncbi:hypothetical protein NLJ89_g11374 [Agrocybe chaxingu]|uniref:Uncharacterized protein n=1 Tax=Agrocybe chaxingu TaxID=84603 RepID=A0A9W8JSH7_9AGAR|nr:hypothetical protein NLJ89_g11374 [Agrocybe chaxingu]